MTNAIPIDAIVGVDTHKDVHAAVAISASGAHLATTTFPANSKGYGTLESWARSMGVVRAFGTEGTGSYGAGLSRFLRGQGCAAIEVNRPNRQLRHQKGKSDAVDAESAARAVLAGQAAEVWDGHGGDDPPSQDRPRHRGQGQNTTHADAQGHYRLLSGYPARAARPSQRQNDAATATGSLADGPAHLHPGSSGKTNRHRLNRGGDWRANAALYRVVITRMRGHQPTLDYIRRRTKEGKSKSEIIRCLKRYIAREIYQYLCVKPAFAGAATASS